MDIIHNSLYNEYKDLYKNKKENYDKLICIQIHLLYLRLHGYNNIKNDILLKHEIKYEIFETIKEIEQVSVTAEYIDEFLLLHKKFSKLLESLN